MTREEALNKWVLPALQRTWNDKKCKEILEALEQEPVLNKIIAEIEQKARPNEIGGRGNGKSIRYGLCMALEIIDKYRKSEG